MTCGYSHFIHFKTVETEVEIIIINNVLHLYSTFPGTQSALHSPPPMCSIRLDAATAAIARQNAHHTPAYWWRGDSDEANQCMGMIRRPWWSEASGRIWPGCQGYTSTLSIQIHFLSLLPQFGSAFFFSKEGVSQYFYPFNECTSHWCLVMSFWLKVCI